MINQITPDQLKTIKRLKRKITTVRRRLNQVWDENGCTNAAVLAVAERLDRLCNQYYRLTSGKNSTPTKGENLVIVQRR